MARVEVMREGPWALVACSDTDPAWVGWVHDSAPVWLAEVVRAVRAGRAAGVEGGPLPGLWAAQVQHGRAVATALGALCAALNTPVPSFGPWAQRVLEVDVGPDPWPGWGFTSPGEWRVRVMELVLLRDQRVRDAVLGDGATVDDARRVLSEEDALLPLTFDSLAWRLWLAVDGTVNASNLTGLAPMRLGSHDADYHQNDCNPTGAQGPTGWACVDWSVWIPGFLDADRNTWLNALGALGWEWELLARVADELAALRTVDAVMARCRSYQMLTNAHAVDYLQSRGIAADVPEDLLSVVARDQAARLQVPQSAVITRQIGTQIAAAVPGPIGVVVMVACSLPEILYGIFGQAQGRWENRWGEREPALCRSSLSGVIDLRHPRAPTHRVPAPPAGASSVVPATTGAPLVIYPVWVPASETARGAQGSATLQPTLKKKSSAAPLALGALLASFLVR